MLSNTRAARLAEHRRELQEAREAPVSVGIVEVVRSNDTALQVQSRNLPCVRRWLAREALHPTTAVGKTGDIGELVMKKHAADALGFTLPVT